MLRRLKSPYFFVGADKIPLRLPISLVLMRKTYRRRLITLGLGTAIAVLPYARPLTAAPEPIQTADTLDPPQDAATETSAATGEPVPTSQLTQAISSPADLLPQIDLDRIPGTRSTAPLSPAETPQPLSADSPATGVTPGSPTATMPAAGNGNTSLPLESPVAPEPPPESSGEPIAPTATPSVLEYLTPQANPLLLPTQPEEVEIIGTQPLTLAEAIELSYRNSETLQVARLELERSQAALREAQAALYPTVDLNAGLTGQENQASSINPLTGEVTSNSQLDTTVSGSVEANYNLYTGGRREASIRAAEEQIRGVELEIERQRAQLRLDTTNDYYSFQDATERIRIAQATVVETERNLQDATLREQVGVGTRFDVLTAQVQAANAQQQLVQAQSDQRVAQRSLARRLNLPPSLDVSAAPVAIAGAWPLSLEESIVLAFQNRAELELELVQRSISEQQRQIALSNTLPQVGLFARYNLQDTLNRSTGLTDSVSVGAQLQWRLFDAGAAAAQAEQQDRNIEIAESQFADARNAIRLEVEQAYFNLTSNQENIASAQLNVERAQQALELSQLRFNAGVGTQLEVLNATSDLADAEVNLVTVILNYNRSLASLERAVSNLQAPGETLGY